MYRVEFMALYLLEIMLAALLLLAVWLLNCLVLFTAFWIRMVFKRCRRKLMGRRKRDGEREGI